ncbi:hypothetical protein LTR28_010135 [Elasticomyces elasticus]|nr:hypothetical protein LTR28_010135 [Elasticomyces elasticus]
MDLQHHTTTSALLEASKGGKARLCAIFGGQGSSNLHCLEDLINLYRAYGPLLEELINVAASTIRDLSILPTTVDFHENLGFDIKQWLLDPKTAPSKEYIATAPISFPIITLISLSHYCVACKTLRISPGELRNSLQGVTGHSQGIIAAAAVARSDSWESFFESTRIAIEMSFWIGYESHHETPASLLSAAAVRNSVNSGEGQPTPMLSIIGLDQASLELLIRKSNSQTPLDGRVYLALVNSSEKMVVAGPPNTLRELSLRLRKMKASEGLDQTRILFSKRKPIVDHHSPYLSGAVARVLEALDTRSFTGHDLGIAVYHTRTGENLQQHGSRDVMETLIRAVTVEMVDWPKVYQTFGASHLLDFGPGRISSLVQELTEGTGLRIIRMNEKYVATDGIGSRTDLYAAHMPPTPPNWGELYGPKLKKDSRGRARLDTKMTRLFGVPPVMVAGMTPTTVPGDFVAAVMKAGYHVELAGGGYLNEKDFEDAIRKLAAALPVYRGITCNLIYANPRAIAWQISLLRRLVHDGVRVDGLTIGAGVPSAEIVKEYIETIGLKHISFKPGSHDSLQQVIAIAREHPDFPIGLQWTGGRAGGHHSFEDFYVTILRTYGRVRQCPNIVLIAGSGFGGASDTFPFLTGEWSRSLGYPLMPFDGVLLGSRLMVAKEAHTSPQAKKLILQALGADNSDWHKSYDESTGGVVTVNSEMGQPIHKLATRGVMLWKDLDRRIFSIKDKIERLSVLRKNRDEIVARLNSDFAKPWFAVNSAGEYVEIEDMTYSEILRRLVELMYVRHQQRWIDASYRRLLLAFIHRVQERLTPTYEFQAHDLSNPLELVEKFLHCYPSAETDFLYPEDVAFFMGLPQRRGQKPVNFIPRLDENFETWFKKDSLWQADDVEAVIGQDVQRVCIIHGPVAVRHSTVFDEPAGVILDDISRAHIEMLDRKSYSDQGTGKKSVADNLTPMISLPSLSNVFITEQETRKSYELGWTGALPDQDLLTRHVAGDNTGWTQACLMDKWICQGPQRLPNPIHGDNVTVTLAAPGLAGVKAIKIDFLFTFMPEAHECRLYEEIDRRNDKIKEFYAALWNGSLPDSLKNAGLNSEFLGETVTLSQKMVTDFMNVIEKSDPNPSAKWSSKRYVPLDLCIVVAWTALVKPLLISAIDGDLLRLLHRSISFEYYPGARPLEVGDVLQSSSRIGALTLQSTGKLVEVVAEIRRDHEPALKVISVFFIQGRFTDYDQTFRSTQEPEAIVTIVSEVLQALMLSRNWLMLDEPGLSLIGKTILFKVATHSTYNQKGQINTLQVAGQIFLVTQRDASRCIGRIYFEGERCNGNPVMDFLTRYGSLRHQRQLLGSPGWNDESPWSIRLPKRSGPYSRMSKDTNPIHVCPVFARYTFLPGTVIHGAYTSAAARMVVEKIIGHAGCARFRRYSASFEGMVLPSDVLKLDLKHVGMTDGRMILKIQAYNDQTNDKVLEAEAEIEQLSTAYVFCGQGSQEKGMGFSLLDIVRNDPKTLTIHFGGKRGRQIRNNHLAMTSKALPSNKEEAVRPILKGLTSESTSYTFSDERGLLSSTQFSQPALALMEMAEYEQLRSKGLVQEQSLFAGHSLGEYAALGACTSFMPTEDLLGLIFYRGLRMQNAIQRDKFGRTNFSMIAVDPSRIGEGFKQQAFETLIKLIGLETQLLLEVVNHNLRALWMLGKVCDRLAHHPHPGSATPEELLQTIRHYMPASRLVFNTTELERGRATIPLRGVDIPFHSTFLRNEIDNYRQYLGGKILEENVDPDQLVERWIPNVIGSPFSVDRSYIMQVADVTESIRLRRMLDEGS